MEAKAINFVKLIRINSLTTGIASSRKRLTYQKDFGIITVNIMEKPALKKAVIVIGAV